ncbi:helix-turn-helix domain-containing protein, partial [Lysinibacillus sp. D4B1_S16]|uniref:winged helix-turn-helix domain-containing protein n=1 Tax=Lysinibacillus sp. D4B1_S16 TaxID=2941231 RepID=UPI0020BF4CB4
IDAAESNIDGVREIICGRWFHLLKYLCDNAGQVLSKQQIYERVWRDCLFDDNTVMVHIRKLQEKIEKNPFKGTCIIT